MPRLLLPAVLTAAALLWAAALLAAPLALAQDGIGAVAAQLYGVASRFCHQRVERSFDIGGVQMPVCARCFGLYAAGALGAIAGWMGHARGASTRTRAALLAAAVPTAVTWALEFVGLAPFSNSARFVAALPLGLVAGWWFVQMLRYDADLNVRKEHGSRAHAHGG